jgi:hypothetical protein
VGISPVMIIAGSLPRRARSFVFEWAAVHQQELLEDWDRCRQGEAPHEIEPLE